MGTLRILTKPFFRFRGLLQFDASHRIYVGYCLETGNVVTADDFDMAEEMLVEVLEDEAKQALNTGNLTNLFSCPAAKHIWETWVEVARSKEPKCIDIEMKRKPYRDVLAVVELVKEPQP